MKIGFSTLVCPSWEWTDVVEQAGAMGFDGIEIRGLRGDFDLPLVPALAGDPQAVRKSLSERGLSLICLSTSCTLDARRPKDRAASKASILEFVELSAALGCPFVKVFAGETGKLETRAMTLGRIVQGLSDLAPAALRAGVTLLIENGGDFPGSADMWYIADAVSHPAVKCCWNQCNALVIRERCTTSIPRLGRKIGMVHLCDARFDADGVLLEYVPPGEGDAQIDRQIEILKGLVYDGFVVFEWPKAWVSSLPGPEAVLPQAAKFLRSCVEHKQEILSAYKGDKNPTRFPVRPKVAS
ncbi:MAG: sugar phosphate isomerase/epimerase [Phycisphaerales bacterium]|nr:MAG: sugar phosphate isomerase/epimerase [Phycisphaerales bacterium]